MSRKWAIALVAITFFSVGGLIGTVVGLRPIAAAKEPGKITPARMGYVNIAKVLHDFEKAYADGKKITNMRQEYVEKMKPLREALDAKQKQIAVTVNAMELEVLEKEANALDQQLGQLDKEAQKALSDLTDKTIVDVYRDIRESIARIADELGLDVVLAWPDSQNPEEDKKVAVAQLKLQTPALIPFYLRPELDITEMVVKKLNAKYRPAQ
jgi:Skp family chaperone for outer membrane proteins